MNFEFWTTVGSVGTFLVIGATAIAAVIQLRHLRNSNELNGLLTVLSRVEDPQFNEWVDGARSLLEARLPDPEYRRQIEDGTMERRDNPWLNLANSYEWVGSMIKHRLISEEAFMDVYAYRILQAWSIVEDVIAIRRRQPGMASVWENFEYLVVRAREFNLQYANGTYPKSVARLTIPDRWLAADRELRPVTA